MMTASTSLSLVNILGDHLEATITLKAAIIL